MDSSDSFLYFILFSFIFVRPLKFDNIGVYKTEVSSSIDLFFLIRIFYLIPCTIKLIYRTNGTSSFYLFKTWPVISINKLPVPYYCIFTLQIYLLWSYKCQTWSDRRTNRPIDVLVSGPSIYVTGHLFCQPSVCHFVCGCLYVL